MRVETIIWVRDGSVKIKLVEKENGFRLTISGPTINDYHEEHYNCMAEALWGYEEYVEFLLGD